MQIKAGTADQGWALEEKLDEVNRHQHPFNGAGADESFAYVIKKGDQVVGGVAASSDDNAIGYIELLWVDETFRRQGLGRVLLATVEQNLQAAGCKRVRLETFDYQAPAFYRENGYHEFAKLNYDYAGVIEYFFVKMLSLPIGYDIPPAFSIEVAEDLAMEAIENKLHAYNVKMKPLLQEKMGVTFTFLAEENGQCIGGIFGYSTMYKIGYIESLWVAETNRHAGVGTALVDALLNALKDFGCPIVHLDTMSYQGAAFYKALGFEQFGQLTYPEIDAAEFFFVKHLVSVGERTINANK
ncbi:GNAT family N-acetyltransferase [Lacticaseibacillus paracasei]|uniref:GNAT family N-acetyltransferase n=1 Tax=Lacticaseibacillus paracasei TaxID=1597 RepID=UPI001AD6AB1F|nr:GNAT family N-acetyltransferase [Lacticaseibacillus paracasei]QTH68466.1 GNAT family N-acetyltransferase [Lacticaseibacillus paracasei]